MLERKKKSKEGEGERGGGRMGGIHTHKAQIEKVAHHRPSKSPAQSCTPMIAKTTKMQNERNRTKNTPFRLDMRLDIITLIPGTVVSARKGRKTRKVLSTESPEIPGMYATRLTKTTVKSSQFHGSLI